MCAFVSVVVTVDVMRVDVMPEGPCRAARAGLSCPNALVGQPAPGRHARMPLSGIQCNELDSRLRGNDGPRSAGLSGPNALVGQPG